jgi:hypothetical protein
VREFPAAKMVELDGNGIILSPQVVGRHFDSSFTNASKLSAKASYSGPWQTYPPVCSLGTRHIWWNSVTAAEPSVLEESFLTIACSNKESWFCDEKRLGTWKKKQEATRNTSRIKATHESRALTPPITIMLDLLALLLPRWAEEELKNSRLFVWSRNLWSCNWARYWNPYSSRRNTCLDL